MGRSHEFFRNWRWNLSPLRGNPYDPWTLAESSPSYIENRYEMAAGVRTKATILSVADNEIQMKLPDGTVWQMTHRTPFDPPVEIKSPGLNQQDWVIRSAQPFAPSRRGG